VPEEIQPGDRLSILSTRDKRHSTLMGADSRQLVPGHDAGADTARRTNMSSWLLQNPGLWQRHRASFCKLGHRCCHRGIILNAPEIAVLAAAQCTHRAVTDVPRGNLSTGDELVKPDQPLQPGLWTLISQ